MHTYFQVTLPPPQHHGINLGASKQAQNQATWLFSPGEQKAYSGESQQAKNPKEYYDPGWGWLAGWGPKAWPHALAIKNS